jgi:hypothetical protein
MARETRAEWARRIEEWSSSGLTGAEFAAEVGVKESTLRHWKWQLDRKARSRARKPTFVRVAPVEVRAVPVVVEPIEIVLRGGIRIRVPERFDAGALRRVLEVVGTS